MKNQNNITVIIRTKNSDKTLNQCLNTLSNQTYALKEIIIVDSGSTDSTLEIAKKHNCSIIHYPHNQPFNYAKAINIGIEESKSQYILIFSSHTYMVHVNLLQYMCEFLSSNNSVCAVSVYHKPTTVIQKHPHNIKDIIWLPTSFKNLVGPVMSNTCSLIKRKYWEEYPFNEAMPTAEDQDWIYHHLKNNNLAHIAIFNACITYNNPYFNAKKDIIEYISIGRYVFPNFFSWRKLINLLTILPFSQLAIGNISRFFYYYKLAYYIIRERLGLGIKITSSYNKKLSK